MKKLAERSIGKEEENEEGETREQVAVRVDASSFELARG